MEHSLRSELADKSQQVQSMQIAVAVEQEERRRLDRDLRHTSAEAAAAQEELTEARLALEMARVRRRYFTYRARRYNNNKHVQQEFIGRL